MEWLITGKIVGTFGLEGFLKVVSTSGEYEHFPRLKKIRLFFSHKQSPDDMGNTMYTIDNCILRNSDALLKLEGIDSPESAKKLQGASILVPRDMACPLKEGEFYITDLCNAVLVYKGTVMGVITDIVEGGGGLLLELSEAATGKCQYVPFRSEFIGTIDIPHKTVELMHRWILE